ncbi:lytic transglycosylase domain-containing protein [Primorskyibacter sp. S187A]|uniref:lytic transglycosylase domain-containing protein n=1 Tax=Primorskyibacter sp. S187A TaxID=3415130 RepID=UPI003C7E7453
MTRAILCAFAICLAVPAFGQTVVESSLRPVARPVTDVAEAPPVEPSAEPSKAEAEALAQLRPKKRDAQAIRPLARAMDAVRAEDWALALQHAAADGPVAQDIVLWNKLRAGEGSAAEVTDFLSRNSDWPGLPLLKEKSEPAMVDAGRADVLQFFAEHTPRTGIGALTYALALRSADQDAQARAVIVEAWKTLDLEPSEKAVFLNDFSALLRPHHWDRLDLMLWKGWTNNPRRMEGLVSEAQWQLAQARMALRRGGSAGDIPAELRNDPGLAFERFRIARGKAKQDILMARSTSAEMLGRPEFWAPDRRPMARALMRRGELSDAYRVASSHFLTSGRDFADLEWLSGYLSLRLGNPSRALAHFERFRDDVFTPISLGRAGYWVGRAHAALGNPEAAEAAYRQAARYQTSFYGLLAAERVGVPIPDAFQGRQPEGDWRTAAFTTSRVHKAATLLLAAGEDWPAERFWTHLSETLPEDQIRLMGKMLEELGQPHIEVMLGKRAAQAGLEIHAPYYARHPIADLRWPVPAELVLAIARRESEFDPGVVSHAGARGLMQLMPATARDVSADLGLSYSFDGLLTNPGYNARLGAEYLRQMALRYDGNPVLMAIAYNAGPGRADRWQELYGSPRGRGVDIVDWIEGIPFRETRNYVMRVTESLPIYRARLGLDPLPQPFSDLLVSSALRPRAVEGE